MSPSQALEKPPRWPEHMTIEVFGGFDSPPYVAVARWRRLCETVDAETPELAVEAVMAAVRARLVRVARDGA